MVTGMSYIESVQALFDLVGMKYPFSEIGVPTKHDYRYPHEEPINDKKKVYEYLGRRGISPQTVDYADVREDAAGNIVFNYYDTNNVLTMVKYRPSHKIDKSKGEPKNWCQKDSDTSPLLFNMNKVNPSEPLVITEGECMKGDSEVLTPTGWVRLDEYSGQKVLQITEDLRGEFVTPIAYVKHEYDGAMYCQNGRAVSYEVTENHNVVYVDHRGRIKKVKASDVPKSIGLGYIPCTTSVDGPGIPLTDEQIALYLAISADCTIDIKKTTRHSRFAVRKDRKYQRMKYLLEACGVEYFDSIERKSHGKKYHYLGFKTPDYVTSKLLPAEWIYLATNKQRKFIIEEMVHWDGNKVKTRNQYEYSSKEIHNAEIIQTIAHTCGYTSSIIRRQNDFGKWYKVSVLLKKRGFSHQDGFKTEQYNGMVYCVTVPTGMIMVRQNEHIFITGNCDTLAVLEAGYGNVVSVPLGSQNMHWIEENFDWLEQFQSIIICSDNDEPGVKMRKEAIARLGSWRCKYVEIPQTYTDDKGVIHVVKDANEVLYYMGKKALIDLILNASDAGVPTVSNVSEIDDVDLDEIDGVETGIAELDRQIMRLFYGTLTVVSGRPGSGKTSFLSQLVCQSLDQNIVPLMYSRELPGFLQKSWIYSVMAGPANAVAYESRSGGTYYKITPESRDLITKYYDKKWFLYRDDASNKLDDILKTMESCLRRYSARLIILDNLMTIDVQGDAESELQKQTECVTKLIEFAIKWQAAIVLVCHPRKLESGSDVGIYDIAGTSNIINLAHRTFSLRRIDKDNEHSDYDVVLTLIKDRLYGNANKKIYMYYDPASRRFYSNPEEYNHQYAWEAGVQRPMLPYPHADQNEVYGDPIPQQKRRA